MKLPARVTITEVGPRDGLQNENKWIETADKIRLIDALAATGLPAIEATSFVHPRAIPQMRDSAEVMAGIRRRPGVTSTPPVIHVDNQSSRRYTILDIVADNALGLLHRVSRVISRHGCDVALVLISTEGQKAIDVFHITKAGAKLTDSAIAGLTADFHRMLEA